MKQLRIRLGKGYLQNVGWAYTPTTITSAQLNLYYVAAIMLLENDVLLDQFTEEKIRDPKVLELIERISITHDPAMDGKGYTHGNPVEVELNDGTVLSAWGKGAAASTTPIPREDVVDKFRKVTRKLLTSEAQDAIVEQCERLDTLDDATALIRTLKNSAAAR